jgi:hypothetical protein
MPTPAMCRASRRLRSIPATPVFDHDRAGAAYQAGGQAVQAVAAGVRDSGVQAGDTGLGVTPPLSPGCVCPGPNAGPACRCRRPGSRWAISKWRGLAMTSPVESTAKDVIPRFDPDHGVGPRRPGVIADDLHGHPSPTSVHAGG